MSHKETRASGFTLIEIIVVLALITLLAGVVVPMVSGVSTQGQSAKILAVVDTLKKACSRHFADTGITAREYSGPSYTTANVRNLSMTQTTAGWRGPYIDHPLSYSDNPFGTYVHVYNAFTGGSPNPGGFDLVGGGSDTATGSGNFVRFGSVPQNVAQIVDESLDRSIPGDWMATGQVEYDAASQSLFIFLIDT